MLNTCLKLKGVAVITPAVTVDSSDVESVNSSTFQIWDVAGRGGGRAGRVVTSNLLGQHKVAEGSF